MSLIDGIAAVAVLIGAVAGLVSATAAVISAWNARKAKEGVGEARKEVGELKTLVQSVIAVQQNQKQEFNMTIRGDVVTIGQPAPPPKVADFTSPEELPPGQQGDP